MIHEGVDTIFGYPGGHNAHLSMHFTIMMTD